MIFTISTKINLSGDARSTGNSLESAVLNHPEQLK